MRNYLIAVCLLQLSFYNILSDAQRVAPGVPPQHYQQGQQHPQQFQQPQQHQQFQQGQPQQFQQQAQPQQFQQQGHPQQFQQGQPQQFQQQQVPMQQQHVQQQQVPMQQHAQMQQHEIHGRPQPGQILNAANIQHEKEHIQEHMEVPIDTSKMSEQELQFHYFKMHDADNNNKLDGCELIKSLIHWHEQGSKGHGQNQVEEKIFKDEELITLIDPILNMDDGNRDGYIDYPEFVKAQQKAAAQSGPPK